MTFDFDSDDFNAFPFARKIKSAKEHSETKKEQNIAMIVLTIWPNIYQEKLS